MKSHIATVAITALIVGATSAGGATMLANHRSPATAAPSAPRSDRRIKPVARLGERHDPCAKLAHTIVGRSVSDRQLRRLMKRNNRCRSVVVNSKSPRKTVTLSRPAPQAITIPAPIAQAPRSSGGFPGGSYHDDAGDSGSQHDD
jgi:hypothetical protein